MTFIHIMAFSIADIKNANRELIKFRLNHDADHERFIFPFLCGSYFTYRKIDVHRIVSIAKTISENPTYLDVGCGYGDFLEKIREYIPEAEGIEKSVDIFYSVGRIKPNYIKIADAYNGIDKNYDVIFVGWMEPGVDYRNKISEATKCIITTFDKGGQCGMNGGCEFDGQGFEKIASWVTPSWIDVNTEIMNKYYTDNLNDEKIQELKNLRGAHNLWYIYCKPELKNSLKETLEELKMKTIEEKYKHEEILDECGFGFKEALPLNSGLYLWEIKIEE
jgi:SAM-dependent methyltransferase